MDPKQDRTIRPLIGVRAFGAWWVVMHHMGPTLVQMVDLGGWIFAMARFGYLGVDLFCFLSGFVIAYNYAHPLAAPTPRGVGRFLWLRIARIYPLHVFALACTVGIVLLSQGLGALRRIAVDTSFWLQLGLVHGWGFEDELDWNQPSWTLSSEWLCYLLFPLIAPLIVRLRGGAAAAGAALTVAATIAAMRAVGHPDFGAFVPWGVVRIGGEFLAGCLMFRAFEQGFLARLPWGWISLAVFPLALAISVRSPAATVIGFGVVIYGLAWDRGPLASFFGNRVLCWLGETSFAVYMMHGVMMGASPLLMGASARYWHPHQLLVFQLSLIFVAATLTYLLVERPTRRELRRWWPSAREA